MVVHEMVVDTYDTTGDRLDSKVIGHAKISLRPSFGSLQLTVRYNEMVLSACDGDGKEVMTRTFDFTKIMTEFSQDLDEQLKTLTTVQKALKEAGIGEQPNPLRKHGKPHP